MEQWFRARWRGWKASFDPDEATSGSQPVAILIAVGSLSAVLAAIGYFPPLARGSGFERPWIAIAIAVVGGLVTLTAFRFRARGRVGTVATLFDNALYSASLTYAATSTDGGYATGLAVAHGLMVLALPAQVYALSLPFAVVYAIPLVLGLLLREPTPTVTVVLVCTYPLLLLISYLTGKRRQLLRTQAKLTEAIGAVHQVAGESVQTALAATLLSLGNFLHELKSLQLAVRVNLAFIAESAELDDESRAAVRDAIQAQDAETDLVKGTMETLKRRAKPTDTVFDLRDTLVRVAAASAGVHVEVEGDAELELKGVAEHLEIVFTNLIRNAEQAGAKRVVISVRLEPGGHAARILVHDDGPGIDPALYDKLFEPFGGTTKPDGTGLGLYLCRRHVELFGGSISVGRGPLGGAAFTMVLLGHEAPTGAEIAPRA